MSHGICEFVGRDIGLLDGFDSGTRCPSDKIAFSPDHSPDQIRIISMHLGNYVSPVYAIQPSPLRIQTNAHSS